MRRRLVDDDLVWRPTFGGAKAYLSGKIHETDMAVGYAGEDLTWTNGYIAWIAILIFYLFIYLFFLFFSFFFSFFFFLLLFLFLPVKIRTLATS